METWEKILEFLSVVLFPFLLLGKRNMVNKGLILGLVLGCRPKETTLA